VPRLTGFDGDMDVHPGIYILASPSTLPHPSLSVKYLFGGVVILVPNL